VGWGWACRRWGGNGNSALAGASGAAMGEFIAQQLYPNIKREDLTEEQRQTISSLSTLAAGLAGGLTGDSSADAVAGAQAGKTTVENNYLSADQTTSWLEKYKAASSDDERKHLIDVANKADKDQRQKAIDTKISKDYLIQQQDDLIRLIQSSGCDADCQKLAQYSIDQLSPIIKNYDELQLGNNLPRAAIATITLAIPILSKAVAPIVGEWIGSQTIANRVIGAGTSGAANMGIQGYNIYNDPEKSFSWAGFGTSVVTGGVTAGMGYRWSSVINTAGAGFSSAVDGDSPWVPMAGAFAGSTVGYYTGGYISNKIDGAVNPWSNGFKERFSLNSPMISAPAKIDFITPSIWGGGRCRAFRMDWR